MDKDYQKWHEYKRELHQSESVKYFYEREIWWCSLGVNIGYEEDGKSEYFSRPILVLKKFNKNMFIGVPLSTTKKEGIYYHHFYFANRNNVLLLSQLKVIDSRRLLKKMGMVSDDLFEEVRNKLKQML